jgi:hypothetical protein
LLTKACLACGYRGPSLQGRTRAVRCPSCGADLYSRPPRSYAELEGFVPMSEGAEGVYETEDEAGESRWGVIKRAFVRVMVIGLIVTPPLVVVGAAGALAAIWILRR